VPQPPQERSRLPGPHLHLRLASRWFFFVLQSGAARWGLSQSQFVVDLSVACASASRTALPPRAASKSISLRCTWKILP